METTEVLLPNPGSSRDRRVVLREGERVQVCVWGRGIFTGEAKRVFVDRIVLRGVPLTADLDAVPVYYVIPLKAICFISKKEGPNVCNN